MIYVLPIVIYILLILIIYFLTKHNSRSKTQDFGGKIGKRILITSVILFLPLASLYFSYVDKLVHDNQYDVKKWTFVWYATMDNKSITQFPLIGLTGEVVYNRYGIDRKDIGSGWEIKYESRKSSNELIPLLKDYFLKEGFKLEIVDQARCTYNTHRTNEFTLLFAGVSDKGECLDLTIKLKENGNSEIEALIVY